MATKKQNLIFLLLGSYFFHTPNKLGQGTYNNFATAPVTEKLTNSLYYVGYDNCLPCSRFNAQNILAHKNSGITSHPAVLFQASFLRLNLPMYKER